EEIDAAFSTIARERADALFVLADSFFATRRVHLAISAARHAVPATLWTARLCGGRWADELRNEPYRCAAPSRRLYWPHPQRGEARRSAGPSADQVRIHHEPANS